MLQVNAEQRRLVRDDPESFFVPGYGARGWVSNGGITVSGFRGFFAFLGYRHTSHYRLDGEDPTIRASGLDVVDFSMRQRIRRWVDFNLSIDNFTNKRYFETQNYFESRVSPAAPIIARIHGTPGYSIGFTAGLTFRIGRRNEFSTNQTANLH